MSKISTMKALDAIAAKINAAHEAGQQASEKGVEHFRKAGELLLEAKARCGHGLWKEWLRQNVHVTFRKANRYMALAKKDVTSFLEDDWRIILGNDESTTAQRIVASNENEWYTPSIYVEAARNVLGGIDLDPASSSVANRIVKANKFYAKKDDGLKQLWNGRVYLNPPYGRLAGDFVGRLIVEYQANEVSAAVVLVNAHCTDTEWFAGLWDHLLCFTDHRIDFNANEREKKTTSTHGSVFAYLGDQHGKFLAEFSRFGPIVQRIKR